MPVPGDSAVGRAVQKMAGSAAFARIGAAVFPRFDRFLHKVSGGRLLSGAGVVPSLMLNALGAKSGEVRRTPLATLPLDGAWYIVGSNFGQQKHPLWTGNLMANPDASISFRGQTYDVRARLLTKDEKAAVWPQLIALWPTYDVYVERSQRDLRVFRLDKRERQD
jgi:deazaflavin-dependent oxidoreductase (nitroreductase family)